MASIKLSLAGLAFRAGRALAGSAACEKGLKCGSVRLLVVQQGISPGSHDRLAGLCRRSGAKMLTVASQDDIGMAIGRPGIMLLGITDSGFADAIMKNYYGGSALNEQTEDH